MKNIERKNAYAEVYSPQHIVKQMLSLIPDNILIDPTKTFLDNSCGNGAILTELVLKRQSLGVSDIVIAQNIFGWDILEDNILETRNNLKAILSPETHTHIDHRIIQTTCSLEAMKAYTGPQIDVVIMNPPYNFYTEKQIADNTVNSHKTASNTIYHLFIEGVINNLKPELMISIHPNKWMLGGKGLSNFRNTFKADKHIEEIILFMNSKEVFPTVEIAGGVQILKWNKNYNGLCNFNGILQDLNKYDIIVLNPDAHSILDKVLLKHTGSFISDDMGTYIKSDLETNFSTWSNNPNDIKCLSRGRKWNYVSEKYVNPKLLEQIKIVCNARNGGNAIPNYKVATRQTNSEGIDRRNIVYPKTVTKTYSIPAHKKIRMLHDRNVMILQQNEITTQTYITLKQLNTEAEVINFKKYVLTKFFQFMLSLRVISQNINKMCYSWVPCMQDYTKEYTDEWLYKHFRLTEEEIEIIDSKIK